MQVQVTMTFDSAEAAAAFLAGKSHDPLKAPKPTSAPTPAPVASSERTAEAAPPPVAAQETKVLDFDKDVVPKLRELSTKDKAKFGELMKKHGVANAKDVQAKPAIWAELVAACG